MSSRLFQDLRERSGLCYSVYSTFSLDRSLGLWMALSLLGPPALPPPPGGPGQADRESCPGRQGGPHGRGDR